MIQFGMMNKEVLKAFRPQNFSFIWTNAWIFFLNFLCIKFDEIEINDIYTYKDIRKNIQKLKKRFRY